MDRTTRAKRIDVTVLLLPGWRTTKAVRTRLERAFCPTASSLACP